MMSPYLRSSFMVDTALVADPQGRHRQAMRHTLWLYLYLLAAVRSDGERLVDPAEIGRHMGLAEATVRTWLGQLRKAGYVLLTREGPHLWVKLTRRGRVPDSTGASKRPMPVESGDPASPEAAALALRLGEPQAESRLEALLIEYGPGAIEREIGRVMAVPTERIKKSRTALLAYFLKTSK